MYRCSCLTFKVLQLHTTVLSASSDLLSFTLDMEFSTEFLPISSDNYSVPLVTSLIPHFLLLFVQFNSVAQSYPTLCDPMNCCTPGLPVHHQLPESTQTYVYWVSDTMQPSHLLSSPSPPALNLSQHQGLFKWISSLHRVAKVLEFQLQHQSLQWTLRTDLL